LGALGLGALFTAYHWLFIVLGCTILAVAGALYLREQRRCARAGCAMDNRRTRLLSLGFGALAVVTFAGLNLYTALGRGDAAPDGQDAKEMTGNQAQITMPVEGLTCVSCEIALEQSLTGVAGVKRVKASTEEQCVTIAYDAGRLSVSALVEAINKTGYRAKPQER
jgi:copper chaperone CopZ